MDPVSRPAAPASARLAWLDVAKGGCIVLVVLHHVITKYLPVITPPDLSEVVAAWEALTWAVKPVRMPVFFVISGFFAANAIARPWPQVLRRVVGPYYLYLVWLAIYVVFYRIETRVEANRITGSRDLVTDLVLAETSMWFLFALAAYFVLAKLLRRCDPRLVIAGAALVALWTGWSGIEETNKASVLSHFVFFALGAFYPRLLGAAAAWGRDRIGALGVVYLAVFVALEAIGLPWSVTLLGASVVGIPMGLALAARAGDAPTLSAGLSWLGARTLRIYVLHFALIGVLLHVPFRVQSSGSDGALLAAMMPALATALIIAGCLGLHRAAVYYGGAALFRTPAPLEWATAQVSVRLGAVRLSAGRLSAGRGSPAPAPSRSSQPPSSLPSSRPSGTSPVRRAGSRRDRT